MRKAKDSALQDRQAIGGQIDRNTRELNLEHKRIRFRSSFRGLRRLMIGFQLKLDLWTSSWPSSAEGEIPANLKLQKESPNGIPSARRSRCADSRFSYQQFFAIWLGVARLEVSCDEGKNFSRQLLAPATILSWARYRPPWLWHLKFKVLVAELAVDFSATYIRLDSHKIAYAKRLTKILLREIRINKNFQNKLLLFICAYVDWVNTHQAKAGYLSERRERAPAFEQSK